LTTIVYDVKSINKAFVFENLSNTSIEFIVET